MKIYLITIGNELLNGKIKDKNAYWLANFCYDQNIQLIRNHLVPDEETAIFTALKDAWDSADVVITSGGLGPTKDDLTKDLVAKFYEKDLIESDEALRTAQKNYEKANRDYSPATKYHIIPKDFEALYNRAGYAPGLLYQAKNKIFASLPGVPSEFKTMFQEEVLPRAKKLHKDQQKHLKQVVVRTWRVPEAKIFTELCPDLWEKLEKFGEVSSLPHPMGVDVGVVLQETSEESLSKKEREVIELIKNTPLKEHIWHIGKDSLEELIIKEASLKNMTIGFAESCTGGLLASRITDVSGSSKVFLGSIIAYANSVKENVLNVSSSTLKEYGAVSKETAWEMAQGARKALGADLVVTTTGIAGPGGATPGKPVGTVGIGHSMEQDCASEMFHFTQRDREDMKYIFSQAALYKMLEQIRNYSSSEAS